MGRVVYREESLVQTAFEGVDVNLVSLVGDKTDVRPFDTPAALLVVKMVAHVRGLRALGGQGGAQGEQLAKQIDSGVELATIRSGSAPVVIARGARPAEKACSRPVPGL